MPGNAAASKRHYDAHPGYYREHRANARERKAAFIRSQKEVPCTDCGVQYPFYVMEFDHLEERVFAVGSMSNRSWREIREEIAKCEVVCANCHAARTWLRKDDGASAAQSTAGGAEATAAGCKPVT